MNTKGFTLLELLVVVLIIGILAAVALPQYNMAVEKARAARVLPLIRAIRNAQKTYFLANNTYATNFDELDIELPAGASVNDEKTVYTYSTQRAIMASNGFLLYPNTNIGYFFKWYNEGGMLDCWASAEDPKANNICKHISGRKNPTGTSGEMNEYPVLLKD